MPIDKTVNWFVDYNMESYDDELGKPIGTLRIPAGLIHDGKAVDSRSVLANTLEYVRDGLLKFSMKMTIFLVLNILKALKYKKLYLF